MGIVKITKVVRISKKFKGRKIGESSMEGQMFKVRITPRIQVTCHLREISHLIMRRF